MFQGFLKVNCRAFPPRLSPAGAAVELQEGSAHADPSTAGMDGHLCCTQTCSVRPHLAHLLRVAATSGAFLLLARVPPLPERLLGTSTLRSLQLEPGGDGDRKAGEEEPQTQ